MSRTTLMLFIMVLAAAGGGIAYFFLKQRPERYDIAAKPLPDLPPIKFAADDWPWWRGPTRDNHGADKDLVTKWNETQNVIWKTAIPGRGHSSPILLGNKVFLTSASDQPQRQFALCLDRTTGDKLWEATIHEGSFPHKHTDNTYASSTPATDGERLFVAFANQNAVQVTALDLDGKVLWRQEAGAHGGGGSHGYGSSLALWGPYVLVSDDTPSAGWLAALNRATGEIGWRKGRKTGMGSYGTPTIATLNGKEVIVLSGNGMVTAYEPATGSFIWDRAGLGEVSGNTAVVGQGMVFASSGYSKRNLIAVRADGSEAWKKENNSSAPYPPTPLWHDGHLYVASDAGYFTCYEAESGQEKWKERLEGGCYSSPLLVGSTIYVCGRDGRTTVLEASPEGLISIARNKLADGINASPVAAGGKLFIRTETHLYCIGKK